MSTPTHLIRSIFTLGIAQVFSWVGAAVLTVLLPRYLGDANLGKLAFAMAFTQLVGLGADLGTATYLTKEVARDRARGGSLAAHALAMRIPLSLAATILAVALVSLRGQDALTARIVYTLCLAIMLDSLSKIVLAALQGLQQMRILAVFAVVTKLGYAGLAALALFGGGGPFEVAIAYVASLTLGLAVSFLALLRRLRPSLRLDWNVGRVVLVGGLPFFVWQAALLVYGQVDAVLLSFLTHDAVVGWYVAAYRIVSLPAFVPTIIMTVIFPALSAASTDPWAFNAIARRSLHVVTLATVPIALGIALLPDKLIGLLGYPDSFANSILPITLLAVHVPLVGIDMVIGTVLNTRDRQRQWALTAVAAAVLNPLLNLAAIPYTQAVYGNGAIGAAAITTLTEAFMLAVGLRLLPAGVFDRATVAGVRKCLAAGLCMAVAVGLVRDLPLYAPVAIGTLVYGASCLAFRVVSWGDLEQVRLHLARRQGASEAST